MDDDSLKLCEDAERSWRRIGLGPSHALGGSRVLQRISQTSRSAAAPLLRSCAVVDRSVGSQLAVTVPHRVEIVGLRWTYIGYLLLALAWKAQRILNVYRFECVYLHYLPRERQPAPRYVSGGKSVLCTRPWNG